MVPWFRDAFALLLLTALAAAGTAFLHPKSPEYGQFRPGDAAITADEVARLTQPVLWIDARSDEAYAAGHIEGALLLNEDHWSDQVIDIFATWSPDMVVVVYCDGGGCHASQAVAQRLQNDLGGAEMATVYYLEGGIDAWLAR